MLITMMIIAIVTLALLTTAVTCWIVDNTAPDRPLYAGVSPVEIIGVTALLGAAVSWVALSILAIVAWAVHGA